MNASKTLPLTMVVLVLITGWMCGQKAAGPQSIAQENGDGAKQGPFGDIAVVNIASLVKQHRDFKQRIEGIREQVNEFKKQVTVRQAEIESVQRKLQQLGPGSSERDETQLLLVRLQTELRLSGDRQQKGFVKQEAVLYSDTYSEITAVIKRYAETNGIQLVLRANHEPIDPSDQKSVLNAVNRVVVYHAQRDITEEILKVLNAPKDDKSPA